MLWLLLELFMRMISELNRLMSMCGSLGDGKNPSQNELSGENPSGENPSKVSCGENPSPYFGACGENPSCYFQACGENPST